MPHLLVWCSLTLSTAQTAAGNPVAASSARPPGFLDWELSVGPEYLLSPPTLTPTLLPQQVSHTMWI